MSPQYKLYYFNAMYLAEPIRLIFAAANVEYEDVRIERDEWAKIKGTIPSGKVPSLELSDGQFLSQSSAIIRYLAKKYKLAGENDLEAAKCDEYAEGVLDLRQEGAKHFHGLSEEAKAEHKRKVKEEIFPKHVKNFLTAIKNNGSGYIVGKKLTYADILLAYVVGLTCKIWEPTLLDNYPEMKKYVVFINGHPGIKEWIAKRPDTPF